MSTPETPPPPCLPLGRDRIEEGMAAQSSGFKNTALRDIEGQKTDYFAWITPEVLKAAEDRNMRRAHELFPGDDLRSKASADIAFEYLLHQEGFRFDQYRERGSIYAGENYLRSVGKLDRLNAYVEADGSKGLFKADHY
jgi:hypothetical protein